MAKQLQGPLIRIESNGQPYDIRVTHVDSGADLTKCVRAIRWEMDADNQIPRVSLEIVGVYISADLTGELEALSRQLINAGVIDREEHRTAPNAP